MVVATPPAKVPTPISRFSSVLWGAGVVASLVVWASTGQAMADGPAGQDPHSNLSSREAPASCDGSPTGSECIDAAVQYLDQARARLGQPAYQLPHDFTGLPPESQALVLTNLDRSLYGLPPLNGVVGDLNHDAARGVDQDGDPHPSDSNVDGYTSNWAGDYPNIVYAYGAWMYDDGPGGDNKECQSSEDHGCWGHRHDVLWKFDGAGTLALGASAGSDSHSHRGFTLLLVQGDSDYRPTYTYTWSQAVADGAGGPNAGSTPPAPAPPAAASQPAPLAPAPPPAIRLSFVRVRGHTISFRVTVPGGARLRCALSRRTAGRFKAPRFRSCRATDAYRHLRPGRYRLEIRAAHTSVRRYLRVR